MPLIQSLRRHRVARLESREAANEARGRVPARLSATGPWWALGQTELFSSLPAVALEKLWRQSVKLDLPARQETILRESEGRVFAVASGGLKLVTNSADGRRLLEAVIDPGGIFGDLSADEQSVPLTVEALEPSAILRFAREDLLAFLSEHPTFALSVIQELDGQRRRLRRRVESLVFKDVDARVVETIVELSHDYADVCTHGMALDIRLTQQDLADLIGASRERVNRSLRELQHRAYLRREGRVLCIPSISRLERLARASG